ncbi:MAG: hypothetical protein Q4Q23_00835 [Methanobacteriaceae archaeon]|nr:hypothetical protein [Methanobacteriaceae archaeon]
MKNKGQIASEYILLIAITLIILSTIILPLYQETISTTEDIRRITETKNTLQTLENTINIIYSQEVGSKQTIATYSPTDLTLKYEKINNTHYITTEVPLTKNTTKKIYNKVPYPISFNGNSNHYYTNLKENKWYYNTKIEWIKNNETSSININFK